MFEELPDPDSLAEADDATVVAAIEGWGRAEAAIAARRHAAVAELISRRCAGNEDDERSHWACDQWDAAAAEIGAALNLSPRRASTQMYLAQSLRERLPRVAALFLRGRISARLVAAISWRTHLVTDDQAMSLIDADVAHIAETWGPLSDTKLEQAIDALVDKHDPQARQWFTEAARGLNIEFGKPDDTSGTRSMWGRLYSTHAELAERRLTAMARRVCADDPRTTGQRRAEAMGAVFAGADRIACQCGRADCPNSNDDSLADSVVIHVVADQAAVTSITTETKSPPEPQKPAQTRGPAAVMAGGGVVPNPLLAQLIRSGAKVVPLPTPCAETEARYRPSVGLQRFVRSRDLSCRFPGCDHPAEFCDLDHTVPYEQGGKTHASNIKCLCRKHHLLKTFWAGSDGWGDQQLPDGTIIWTSPAGQTYTTHPGSRVYFPDWNVTTAALPPASPGAPKPANRAVTMPKRRRTRAAERAQRIKNRRAQGDTS